MLEYSEEYLAQKFAEKYGHKLRYIAAWRQWYSYNGALWTEDKTLRIFDLSRSLCRKAAQELSAQDEKSNRPLKLASKQTVAAVENLARADRRIAAVTEQFDQNPLLLNTPKGVVDLSKGTIRRHKPEDYFTKITAVSPEGECPLWMHFLDRVTNGDKDLQAFLQRMAGYALTGETKEHSFFFLYGTGRNGKGVFVNTITQILKDYAAIANVDTFTASQYDKHPTDLAMLRGARFVNAQETEEGRRWAESRIKSLTGGDPITARFMRQDFFQFTPQFKLIIAGNHKPGLRNIDEAMRSRFKLVPFTVTIPPEERDKDLPEKLKKEWPGILRWMILGAKLWHESGLQVPSVVSDATNEYMEEEDAIARWLKECCVFQKSGTATATDLWDSWKAWCIGNGEAEGSQKRLTHNIRTKYSSLDDKWQCPRTRRTGFQGLEVIKKAPEHRSD